MAKEIGFEQKLKKLEEMAAQMESGELSLEESLKSYEQAVKIIKECEDYINGAKMRIEKITGGETLSEE